MVRRAFQKVRSWEAEPARDLWMSSLVPWEDMWEAWREQERRKQRCGGQATFSRSLTIMGRDIEQRLNGVIRLLPLSW